MTTEEHIAQAERHVNEALERSARQSELIARLEYGGHSQRAAQARELMETFQQTLKVAHEHLRIERDELRRRAQQKR